MHPSTQSSYERSLSVLCALFILSYFYVFTYDGLHAYFTYDDGMALVALHQVFEMPTWKAILQVLQVFTHAFRPMGQFFWRPLYALFGFNPYPYRVVIHLLLVLNIVLVYKMARSLKVSREAAAITALVFCYNGSMVELLYNTSTVYDILCCTFYQLAFITYVRGRSDGAPLSNRRIVAVILLYFAAFDSKEMSLTLPATLFLYELIYHFQNFKSPAMLKRMGGLIAAMLVMAAIYGKVKVSTMAAATNAYAPRLTAREVLKGYTSYVLQLALKDQEFNRGAMAIKIALILLAGALLAGFSFEGKVWNWLRSRNAIFGLAFFVAALIPVAIIAPRGGYAAYVAYPGLALAVGCILSEIRATLVRVAKKPSLELVSAVVLFLCTAAVLAYANGEARMVGMGHMTWDQSRRLDFFEGMKKVIPEFPPKARVVVTDDPWGPDWGPMFLTRLKYHDNDVWLDRTKNGNVTSDLGSYDAVIKYQECALDIVSAKFFGYEMKWETRFPIGRPGQFIVTSSNPNWQGHNLVFNPPAVRQGQAVTMTAPGLANVKVNALYRVVSAGHAETHTVMDWCTLDASGTCTLPAPPAGAAGTLVVDWIQPENQRWIFTTGVLMVVE